MVTQRELRVFGIGVGLILGAIAAWRGWAGDEILPWAFAGPGALLALLGTLAPRVLAPVHAGWMRVVAPIAWFNTRLLLGIVYFGILLPSGLGRRIFGDPLQVRAPRTRPPGSSYWVDREEPEDLESFRRQT